VHHVAVGRISCQGPGRIAVAICLIWPPYSGTVSTVNRRHPLRALLAALVLSAVGLVIAAPAGADPHDDKAKVDRQLAKVHSLYEAASAQAQAALAAYNAAAAQLPVVQDRLAVARGVVAARQAEANQARRDAQAAQDQAALAQQSADAAARQAGTALDAALAAQSAAEQDATDLTNLIAQQQQAMVAANAQRDAVLAQYAALQRESDRIAAQLRGQSGGVANLHSGHFLTPVHG